MLPELLKNYNKFKNDRINKKRFSHSDLMNVLAEYSTRDSIEVKLLGESIEGRSINMYSWGNGPKSVLMWTQMHGNESTATRAILDLLNFLESKDSDYKASLQDFCDNLTIHIIPMLNPDGAEQFKRRNALDIDLNRDALSLSSPESRILKDAIDTINPDFGFNLHDQRIYYNVDGTPNPATISFLAPAYNAEKEVNETRLAAMQVICEMNEVLRSIIPGQVGKYDDKFEVRAFGDNIQKWGTSTILIEAGGMLDDPEKEEVRKINFVAIVSALQSISSNSYKKQEEETYWKIPDNDFRLYDLFVRNAIIEENGKSINVDIAINLDEVEMGGENHFIRSRIEEIGDLTGYFSYKEYDAKGASVSAGEVFPDAVFSPESIEGKEEMLLKQGYTHVESNVHADLKFVDRPINLIGSYEPRPSIRFEGPADLVFRKNGEIQGVILNGQIVDFSKELFGIKNGLIS